MAKLIPFSGTAAQLYQSYGRACFVGTMTTNFSFGVAGYSSDGTDFFNGGSYVSDVATASLNGFVVVS